MLYCSTTAVLLLLVSSLVEGFSFIVPIFWFHVGMLCFVGSIVGFGIAIARFAGGSVWSIFILGPILTIVTMILMSICQTGINCVSLTFSIIRLFICSSELNTRF